MAYNPLLLSALLLLPVAGSAQQNSARLDLIDAVDTNVSAGNAKPAGAALPDAPGAVSATDPQQTSSSPAASSAPPVSPVEGRQTKRILGIVPNFRSVSASSLLPPQSAREKLDGFAEDSFDYSSFIFVGGLAGINFLAKSTPEFHQGAKGYARYYWHTYADQTDENLWVEFFLPAIFHQDPRYYTLGHGGALKRTLYSFSRMIITRTDSGGEAFNVSEVGGAGIAGAISNLYYPSKERSVGNTVRQWGTSIGLDGATNVFREFWPDLNRVVFHQK
jgi:hypothetical protein